MTITIVSNTFSKKDLKRLAQETYKEMVKAVVDVQKKILAIGGELHADAEALLLDEGSGQQDLWGINLYPDKPEIDRIEYTSLINIRPRQGNKGMQIQDDSLRKVIKEIVDQRIAWSDSG